VSWAIGKKFEIQLERSIVRNTMYYMETVTISPKYQVVIPQKIRDRLGLRSGEKVRMIPFNGRVEIVPVRPMSQLRGFVSGINTEIEAEGSTK
jgi:AbrB family looped-hinge helix DNA binding protein